MSAGRLIDMVRVFEHVSERGTRVTSRASAVVDNDGSAILTFSSIDIANVYAGVEITVTGRIADLQSALLQISLFAPTWFPTATAKTAAARDVRLRISQLSGSVFYIYIPFLKPPIPGVDENQPVAAAPSTSNPVITITGFSGEGLTVEAQLVSANTAELLRMGASLTLALQASNDE